MSSTTQLQLQSDARSAALVAVSFVAPSAAEANSAQAAVAMTTNADFASVAVTTGAVCTKGWNNTTRIGKPAYAHLGYGAGMHIPTPRPRGPM